MPLYRELRVGESLRIDKGPVVIKLVEKSGQRARLALDAPREAAILHIRPASIAAKGISDRLKEA